MVESLKKTILGFFSLYYLIRHFKICHHLTTKFDDDGKHQKISVSWAVQQWYSRDTLSIMKKGSALMMPFKFVKLSKFPIQGKQQWIADSWIQTLSDLRRQAIRWVNCLVCAWYHLFSQRGFTLCSPTKNHESKSSIAKLCNAINCIDKYKF